MSTFPDRAAFLQVVERLAVDWYPPAERAAILRAARAADFD